MIGILIVLLFIVLFICAIVYWAKCLESFTESDEWKEHKSDPEYWDTNYPWP